MESYDAVIIGSGINGLVAAAELAMAGWSVALIERQPQIGGSIASGERTLPGYIHDTFSSWHPLFVSGGAYATVGAALHDHGLEYRNSDDALTGSTSREGSAVAYRDPARTARGFEDPQDQEAYLNMLEQMGERAESVFGVLGSELPTGDVIASMLSGAVRSDASLGYLMRDAVSSGRAFMRRRFAGPEPDRLWAPWLLHAGLSPDSASGGVMIPVLALTMHGFGLPVVAGGAANFLTAFRRLLDEHSVSIMTGRTAESIEVVSGRATGVVTDSGTVRARRAVIASVTPQKLYGELLRDVSSTQARREASEFRFGRAAMQLHVALDRPLTFADDRLVDVPLVHVSDGSGSTGVASAQAEAGMLPSAPTIAVGRQHLIDPSRVPDGRGSLWLQLQELPWRPTADAGGSIAVDGSWSEATVSAYVDRVLGRLEEVAPGTTASILKVDTLSPADLAAANVNAVDGDPYGGSAELDQSLMWRPLPSAPRHTTDVQNLWHIGASTRPGAGLGGGSGHLVGQALLSIAADGTVQRLSN